MYTAVPYSPLADDHLTGCTVGKALFLSMVFMTVLGCILSVVMWLKRKHKGKRDPLERGCVAQGKHPNVVRSYGTTVCKTASYFICLSVCSEIFLYILPQSLRWFTVVSHLFYIEVNLLLYKTFTNHN